MGVPLELLHVWLPLVRRALSQNVMNYLSDPVRFSIQDLPPD